MSLGPKFLEAPSKRLRLGGEVHEWSPFFTNIERILPVINILTADVE